MGAQDVRVETASFAYELATLLAEEGWVVVGGLDSGVERATFDGALSAAGGQTVAVLPMGISAFPGPVAAEQGGALLVSPFHPDAKLNEAQALARNKLIVGLAEALFVVAAGETGATREAADEALRLGKAVYVWDVDPAVEPTATGHQALIEAGALPITGLPDILDALEAVVTTALELEEGPEPPPAAPPPPTVQEEDVETPFDRQAALDLLSRAGRVPESLARRLRGD
jgi:predicted Rossmann fold nucleotide-binding protein DprA/Smf involved in DNA uptake